MKLRPIIIVACLALIVLAPSAQAVQIASTQQSPSDDVRKTPLEARDEARFSRLGFKAIAELLSQKSQALGKSLLGRNMRVLNLRSPSVDKNQAFKILIQGGLHGNEYLSPEFVFWLAERFALQSGGLYELAEDLGPLEIDFLPIANPDGRYLGRRENARGVDLNRNFRVMWGMLTPLSSESSHRPSIGAFPMSEPEAATLGALLKHGKYDFSFDIHGYVDWLLPPSPRSAIDAWTKATKDHSLRKLTNDDDRRYKTWNSTLGEMAEARGLTLINSHQLGHGGAYEDYAFWQHGALSACIELSPALLASSSDKLDSEWVGYESMLVEIIRRAVASERP